MLIRQSQAHLASSSPKSHGRRKIGPHLSSMDYRKWLLHCIPTCSQTVKPNGLSHQSDKVSTLGAYVREGAILPNPPIPTTPTD